MQKTILIAMVLASGLATQIANADFTFGEPTGLGERINTPADEILGCISKDGLSLYFSDWIGSNYPVRPGGHGQEDIWVATRVTTNDEWGEPQNLGSPINTDSRDLAPDLSADGLVLHFSSDRSGNWDLYIATRATTHDDWTEPKGLETINTAHGEMCPRMTSDGLALYFTDTIDNRPGGQGKIDLWVSKRASTDDDWSEPTNLGPMVNSSSHDFAPHVSSDELNIFFGSTRPGGLGAWDIWVTTRATTEHDWGQPKNLGPPINTSFTDDTPVISFDGTILYFKSRRPDNGDLDLWQAPIKPVVDLNGDGIVDAEDLCIVVDNWGTDNQLCDIGPMPWGDGVVDVQDLIVLAEHLFEEFPPVESAE